MAQSTLLTRDDFLGFLPGDAQKIASDDQSREVYCFTNYQGSKAIIGFVGDEPLPRLEDLYVSDAKMSLLAQEFLAAA